MSSPRGPAGQPWRSRLRTPMSSQSATMAHPATGGPFMSWSVNIGSIAGTAIRIHITFLLFLVWIFVAGLATGGVNDAVTSLVFLILLFACVVAHDFGH